MDTHSSVTDDDLRARREKWRYRGSERPSFALPPSDNQESVWDYPRPPAIRLDQRRVVVARETGELIGETTSAVRVLETAGPPVFYLPISDLDMRHLKPSASGSSCEWKGAAQYYDLVRDEAEPAMIESVGWRYSDPLDGYGQLANMISFYPSKVVCTVDGETVRPQHGGLYGGWVTDEIVGPWKGQPGTENW